MANTTTKTFTSGDATWTISVTGTDGFVTGDTFVVPYPSKITAKYVQASKTYCQVKIYATSSIEGFMDSYRMFYRGKYVNGSFDDNTLVASTSGTTYTLTPVPESDSGCWAQTRNTSTYWNKTNKTTRTIDIEMFCHAHGGLQLSTGTSSSVGTGPSYLNGSKESFSFVSTITLDAPPQVELGTPTYSSQYAGVGTYTVPITTATAQYKGDISSVKLTVGTQIEEQTYSAETISNETISIVPSVAGEFIPTITVTDSRGQTTTVSLSKITVLPYSGPSINFDVYRTNSVGIKDDEGSYGLIKLTQDYISNAVNIIQPTVAIDETETNNVIWYSTYSESQGVSNIISNWSQVPSGVQIYGLINETFSLSESYKVTVVAHDSYGKSSIAITQTMSTAYYTIDFKAGGKEIAFGKPANDTLTQNQESVGLFKCGMEAQFKDAVVIERLVGEIKAYAGATVPNGWLECDGSELLIEDYPLLAAALGADHPDPSDPDYVEPLWGAPITGYDYFILPNLQGRVPVGYDSNDVDFDAVGEMGGNKNIQAHTHAFTQPNGPSHSHPTDTNRQFVTRTNNSSGVGESRAASGTSFYAPSINAADNWWGVANTAASGTGKCTGGAVGAVSGASTGTSGNLQPYAVVKYIICAV